MSEEQELIKTINGIDDRIRAIDEKLKTGSNVILVDMNIPLISMVVLMVKWAIAAIPAMFILFFLAAIFSSIFGGMFAALMH